MIDDRELVRRVTASFEAYARTVSVPDEPFEPTRRLAGAAEVAARPDRRRRLLLVAAVLVVTGAAGAAVLSAGERDDDHVTAQRIVLAAPVAPTDALAPTWAPEGWERSYVGWSSPATGLSSTPDDALPPIMGWPDSGDRAQLFGDPDDPDRKVLVESGGGVVAQDLTGLTVRDRPAEESDPGFGLPWLMSHPDLRSVSWTEAGVPLRAVFALADRERALAFIDRLVARPGGPAEGFDVAPDDDLAVLGEATAPAVPPTSTHVGFTSGREPRLSVDTFAATGGSTVEHLTAWFYGDRSADGTASAWDADSATLISVQPDGRLVRAQVYALDASDTVTGLTEVDGLGPARPIAEEAVAGVAPVDAGTLETWWEDVNAARVSLPLLARVELPTAAIEVRGDGEVAALCQVEGGESACVPVFADPGDEAWTRLRIGDAEYVVAANKDTAPVPMASKPEGSDTRVLDAETGHDGDWYVALAALDPSLGALWIDTDADGEAD